MEKNILLILGHPSENSFCKALLDAYQKGAESTGGNCKILYVSKLNFNVNLADGYKTGETMPLEEDLVASQQLLKWADHVVMAYPNWWGFMPAITKGFIDRVFLPGFAFQHHSGNIFPEKLLKGKSMRLLVTMDTPKCRTADAVVLPYLSGFPIPNTERHCVWLCWLRPHPIFHFWLHKKIHRHSAK